MNFRASFEQVLDQVPSPIWLASLDARPLWMNRAWIEFTGVPREEALATPWTRWTHSDDTAHVARISRDAIERRAPFETIARRLRADGEWRWVLNRGVPYVDESGEIVAYIGLFTDVTERRQAQIRLQLVLDHLGSAAFLVSREGRFLYVNREWQILFNASGRPVVGERLDCFFSPQRVSEMLSSNAATIALGARTHLETTLATSQGSRAFLVSKFPLTEPLGGEPAICGIATDVTELRHSEARQRELERRLAEGRHFENLGVLAGGLAHDFNNLLQSMMGHASLLDSELPADSPSRMHLRPIEEAATRAARLTEQMLDYAGLSMRSHETIPVDTLLLRWERTIRPLVPFGLSFQVQCEAGLPRVLGDEQRLHQALTHLASNAVDALSGRPGGFRVRAMSRGAGAPAPLVPAGQPLLPAGPYVVIEFQDDGEGIPEASLDRIWTPFFSTRFVGRGLGLPAALGIARAHGGTIEVSSTPGEGSSFRLVLPAASAEGGGHTHPTT